MIRFQGSVTCAPTSQQNKNPPVEFAASLRSIGWSPEKLAREINRRHGTGSISAKAPYHWLKGTIPREPVRLMVAEIISDLTGRAVSTEQLWPSTASLTPAPTLRIVRSREERSVLEVAVDWLLDRSTNAASGSCVQHSGPRKNTTIIAAIEQHIEHLKLLYREPDEELSDIAGLIDHELAWASQMRAGSLFDDEGTAQLNRAIARLAEFGSLIALDQDDVTAASDLLTTASKHACAAGEDLLAAGMLSALGEVYALDGSTAEALRLLRIAAAGISDESSSALTLAMVSSRRAWTYAVAGQGEHALRCLYEAESSALCGGVDTSAVVEPVDPEVAIVMNCGRAWALIGDYGKAITSYERLLKSGRLSVRQEALVWAWHAEALLRVGETGAAADALAEATARGQRNSSIRAQRCTAEVQELLQQVAAERRSDAVITELSSRLGGEG